MKQQSSTRIAAALSRALSDADSIGEALDLLLRGLLDATAADSAALVLREGGDYTVALALTNDGATPIDAGELLSDRVVRGVLATGIGRAVPDVALEADLAHAPSVVKQRIASLVCAPMRVGDEVVGALYLASRRATLSFQPSHARRFTVLASMAAPLLMHLRRSAPVATASDPIEDRMIGGAPSMVRAREVVRRVAPSMLSVLLTGETGTGKDVFARAIHEASAAAGRPMIALNCAAVPDGLLAAELFGAARGAYTGATHDRRGRLELAHGSTLFLDEIGDMPLPMQAMLLRALEEGSVTRLGEEQPRPAEFRLIAATHRDLDRAIERGEFRQDLYFRIRELTLELPPLRERGEDIVLLARLFMRQAEHRLGLVAHELTEAALDALRAHSWPGNVRELRAAVRRAVVLAHGAPIEPEHLGLVERNRARPTAAPGSLAEAREQFTRKYVTDALQHFGGNREAASAALGISLRSLYRALAD